MHNFYNVRFSEQNIKGIPSLTSLLIKQKGHPERMAFANLYQVKLNLLLECVDFILSFCLT